MTIFGLGKIVGKIKIERSLIRWKIISAFESKSCIYFIGNNSLWKMFSWMHSLSLQAMLMSETSLKKCDLCWKEFQLWLHISAAAPGFPGFATVCVILCKHAWGCVCVCVCIVWEWAPLLFYFSFCEATTCRADLLVWKEMERIVWLVTVSHGLTSFCFPLLCLQIIRFGLWLFFWKLYYHVRLWIL